MNITRKHGIGVVSILGAIALSVGLFSMIFGSRSSIDSGFEYTSSLVKNEQVISEMGNMIPESYDSNSSITVDGEDIYIVQNQMIYHVDRETLEVKKSHRLQSDEHGKSRKLERGPVLQAIPAQVE